MSIFEKIRDIIADLLDIEEDEITLESYLIRDLGAESIDLLELAVALNSTFNIEINDDEIFLKTLRLYLTEAKEKKEDTSSYLAVRFPFLEKKRIEEIMEDLEKGPVIKVKDIVRYVAFR